MLAITPIAAEAIATLLDANGMPDGSGLRIEATSEQDQQALELSVVPGPEADDTVLEGGGATVFLEPVAAEALDEMVLDVQRVASENGQEEYRFALGPRASGSEG